MNFVCSEVENMTISINYYEYIKQMYETLTKYIKSYRSETNDYYKKIAKIHEKYYPRLSGIKEELKKYTNIKTNHIISLSTKVPKIISQQITNLQYFISGIETTIKSFDKTLKEKNSMSSKYQSDYDDCRNSLLKKYREIEKSRNNYFSNASQTEDLIYKYYVSQNPEIDENKISDMTIITENQVENNIKQTKKSENEYLNLVKSAKTYEEKFFELSGSSIDNMKRIACEIITKMKDNIVDFLLLLKNCFKLPLSEIDTYLPELIKLDENKKIENIINSTYKKDNKLIPIKPEKYNIKLINKENNGDEEDNNYIIEDEEILNTIKKMEDSFELINSNVLEKMNNQTKLRCRLLTLKLLSFSPNIIKELNRINHNHNTINEKNEMENNINNDNNKNEDINENDNKIDYSISQEEIEELSKMIEDKGNRGIFLKEMHSFRKYGEFEIPEREFNVLCDLFNKIANLIKKENDSLSMGNIIILSQTYYKLENNTKIYIQNIIKKNKIFKEKEFWDDYVNSTILKEVQKHLNKDMNSPRFIDGQKTMENEKYEKIIYSQILPLINNMIEFGLDDNIIKSIIQTIISYYKINEKSSKTIYDMIKYKGIKDNVKMKKYYKDLNFSVINENNGEEAEIVSEYNKNKNDDNENDNNEGEEDEDDNENINKNMFINVNHTIADEEEEENDTNNKKVVNAYENDEDINDQMIKNVDDDDINEEEEEINEDNKKEKKEG